MSDSQICVSYVIVPLKSSGFCLYLQQVNHAGHLGVDEDSVSLGLETTQQDIQRVQFATFHDQTLLI